VRARSADPRSSRGPAAGREDTTVQMIPQGYPLIVSVEDEQRLVIGWTGSGVSDLAPVTLPLSGPGEPQVHEGEDELQYTLPPVVR
jgi:hypothetical protein